MGGRVVCFGIFRCCAKVDKLKDNVEVWHCVAGIVVVVSIVVVVAVAIVAAAICTIVFVHMANIEFTFRQQ